MSFARSIITCVLLDWLAVGIPAQAEPNKALPKSFALPGLQGGTVERADLRGKVVVLQFFAAWCKGCGEVMGKIAPVLERHPEARFLPVSLDETMSEAKGYFKRQREAVQPIERMAVLDKETKVAIALGVQALPAIVVVDADGALLLSLSGHPTAEQMKTIEALLSK